MHSPWVQIHLVIRYQGVQNGRQEAQGDQVDRYFSSKVGTRGEEASAALAKEVALLRVTRCWG